MLSRAASVSPNTLLVPRGITGRLKHKPHQPEPTYRSTDPRVRQLEGYRRWGGCSTALAETPLDGASSPGTAASVPVPSRFCCPTSTRHWSILGAGNRAGIPHATLSAKGKLFASCLNGHRLGSSPRSSPCALCPVQAPNCRAHDARMLDCPSACLLFCSPAARDLPKQSLFHKSTGKVNQLWRKPLRSWWEKSCRSEQIFCLMLWPQ